jgi:hypothetical protein
LRGLFIHCQSHHAHLDLPFNEHPRRRAALLVSQVLVETPTSTPCRPFGSLFFAIASSTAVPRILVETAHMRAARLEGEVGHIQRLLFHPAE